MSTSSEELVEALRESLRENDRLRKENQRLADDTREPIAIVGMACRLPGGVTSPADLWDMLVHQKTGVSEFPGDRGWDIELVYDPTPGVKRKSYVNRGGFLQKAGNFDPEFFGIAPREALAMDPQQRVLLETAWETIENARIDPHSLRGTKTAVYAGSMYHDYISDYFDMPDNLSGFLVSGTTPSIVTGRISYTLGLEGASVVVDSACSSSLSAIHLGAQALRDGECSLALAGGVTVLGQPFSFIEFSAVGGLSPDGVCRSFAKSAGGTGWGEGVGMVMLERLSDAQRNGRRILAVIRGSATNQDGASNGLTAPNGPAQQRVIAAALADAGIRPSDVDAVEAHGTATAIGDPIEAQAMIASYGAAHTPEKPLWLGSVKSNISHAQAGAGVAGLIKMVLALNNELLPATLHVDEPTPEVDWSAGTVQLLTEARPWPKGDTPRRAGVSSFGISGTNVHLIVEEAPEDDAETDAQPYEGPVAWTLSAKTITALRGQAERLRSYVAADERLRPVDIAHSLAGTRAVFDNRAVVVGTTREELLAQLDEISSPGTGGKVAYLFTGQGAQTAGMGGELYERYPEFAAAFDEVCEHLDPLLDTPLREVITTGDGLDETRYTQPALFAIEVALFRLFESWGVRPDYVAGHSIGELAAAHVSGVLTLPEACVVVAARGSLMQALPSGGAMIAIQASEDEVTPLLSTGVGIAAINGPTSIVVSGEEGPALEVAAHFEERGRRVKRLTVSHAFHSALMNPMLPEFRTVTAGVGYAQPTIPIVSNVTGQLATAEQVASPDYWVEHVRAAVRFCDGVRTLAEHGVTTFVELGPNGVLTGMAQGCLDDTDGVVFAPALRKDKPEPHAVLAALGALWTRGAGVDWAAQFAGTDASDVDLPTYAFDHKHYWLTRSGSGGTVRSLGLETADHAMLGPVIQPVDSDTFLLTARISPSTHTWLTDHVVRGVTVVPGSLFVELALKGGIVAGAPHIDELIIENPLMFADGQAVQLQVSVGAADESGTRAVSVHSRPTNDDGENDEPWSRHASGTLSAEVPEPTPVPGSWPPIGAVEIDVTHLYDDLADIGYQYLPSFQNLRAAWYLGAELGQEVVAELAVDNEQASAAANYGLHPVLLDSVFHALGAGELTDGQGQVPFHWSDVSLYKPGCRALRVWVKLIGEDTISITATDQTGAPVARVESLHLRAFSMEALAAMRSAANDDSLLALEWVAPDESDEDTPSTDGWAVVGAGELADALAADGVTAHADLAAIETVPPVVLVPAATATAAPADVRVETLRVLEILQAYLADDRFADTTLVAVTTGAAAASAGERVRDLAGSAVWGLLRSAQTENPERFAIVDLGNGDVTLAAVAAALATGEPQAAVRNGTVLVPRLARRTPGLDEPADARTWRLHTEGKTIADLELIPETRFDDPIPATGVRVAVRACALNFRDVFNVLGLAPMINGLGQEGAGIVLEVGSSVTNCKPGDRVIGMFKGSIGPETVTEAVMVAPLPDGMSFAEGATTPLVYTTAYHGLHILAGMKPGERLLVHAAAGGVGHAAIRLAQRHGVEVFGTASKGKWDVLRAMGLDDDHIGDSRSLDFEEKFRATTGGEGVDIVLNSLTGEFIEASYRLLRAGGRFLEMGVADLRDADERAQAYPGTRYLPFELFGAPVEEIVPGWNAAAGLVASGDAPPLPFTAWDVHRSRDAFQFFSQAKQIGKVVITVPRPLDENGTVLVTGGTGTLGAALARHLVTTQGVRHLVLTSRRGLAAAGAPELAAELSSLGADVRIEACDAADRDALAALLDGIAAEHPLTAVIHTAGVVDDGVIASQNEEKLVTTLRPKVDAAWNLHELTLGADLSAFVLFSSAAGIMGGPGQSNYAAANSYLDALAQHRKDLGLPATSVAWGVWAEKSGMTEHLDEADIARMARSGMRPIEIDEGMGMFDDAVGGDHPVLLGVPLDSGALRRAGGMVPPLFRGLAGKAGKRAAAGGVTKDATLVDRLAALTVDERDRVLVDLVRAQVAAVLGLADPSAVEPEKPFKEIGFDSLTSVELRNRVNGITGLKLAPTMVFDHPTPAALAEQIRTDLIADDAAAPLPVLGDLGRVAEALAGVAVDDEDVRTRIDAALQELLAGWQARQPQGEENVVKAKLSTAESADDLFDIIDSELGKAS